MNYKMVNDVFLKMQNSNISRKSHMFTVLEL